MVLALIAKHCTTDKHLLVTYCLPKAGISVGGAKCKLRGNATFAPSL